MSVEIIESLKAGGPASDEGAAPGTGQSQPQTKTIQLSEVDQKDDRYLGRVGRSKSAIAAYQKCDPTELVRADDPLILVWDGSKKKYVIVAGHHRIPALAEKGGRTVEAQVYHQLPACEALLLSAQSNGHHGLKLTNADKKKLCQEYLMAKEAERLHPTDNSVAEELHISSQTVKKYREELEKAGKLKVVDTRQASDGAKSPTPKPSIKPKVESFKLLLRQAGDRAAQLKKADCSELDPAELAGQKVSITQYVEALQRTISEMWGLAKPQGDQSVAAP
jgi:hypothetical protein